MWYCTRRTSLLFSAVSQTRPLTKYWMPNSLPSAAAVSLSTVSPASRRRSAMTASRMMVVLSTTLNRFACTSCVSAAASSESNAPEMCSDVAFSMLRMAMPGLPSGRPLTNSLRPSSLTHEDSARSMSLLSRRVERAGSLISGSSAAREYSGPLQAGSSARARSTAGRPRVGRRLSAHIHHLLVGPPLDALQAGLGRARGLLDLVVAATQVQPAVGAEAHHLQQPDGRGLFRLVGAQQRVAGR